MNDKLNDIIDSERLEIETALNILINAVKNNYVSFNDLDKFLIGKSLQTFLDYYERKEDIVIRFNKNNI